MKIIETSHAYRIVCNGRAVGTIANVIDAQTALDEYQHIAGRVDGAHAWQVIDVETLEIWEP